MPIIKVKTKGFKVAPPKKKIATKGKRVVKEVLKDRAKVSRNEELII